MSRAKLLKEIEEINGQVAKPKPISTRARKAKGRRLQNRVAEAIRHLTGLPKCDISGAIMGESGMDIKLSKEARELFPFAVEAKNQQKLNFWETLKQAEGNAKVEGLHPLVVFKRDNTKTYAILEFDLFMKILKDGGIEDV